MGHFSLKINTLKNFEARQFSVIVKLFIGFHYEIAQGVKITGLFLSEPVLLHNLSYVDEFYSVYL